MASPKTLGGEGWGGQQHCGKKMAPWASVLMSLEDHEMGLFPQKKKTKQAERQSAIPLKLDQELGLFHPQEETPRATVLGLLASRWNFLCCPVIQDAICLLSASADFPEACVACHTPGGKA